MLETQVASQSTKNQDSLSGKVMDLQDKQVHATLTFIFQIRVWSQQLVCYSRTLPNLDYIQSLPNLLQIFKVKVQCVSIRTDHMVQSGITFYLIMFSSSILEKNIVHQKKNRQLEVTGWLHKSTICHTLQTGVDQSCTKAPIRNFEPRQVKIINGCLPQ